jgi:hypothetical protein
MPSMQNDTGIRVRSTGNSAAQMFERFLAVWQDSKARRHSNLLIAFVAGLAAICGVTAFIGIVPTRIYGHDVFVWLGGGWRAIHGQHPHVDFISPFGPVMFMVTGLGLTLSRHSANGIGYGTAIVALIVGIWSFGLSKNRLTSSVRLVLSFFLATLVAAPFSLGNPPFFSSHAMLYNRYGYALLGLILLECFCPPHQPTGSQRGEWIGGISTGAVLSILFFLKVSFFLVAVGLLGGTSLILWRFARQRILGAILGFSVVTACMLAYLRFDVSAMIADLRMAAGARAEVLRSPVSVVLLHLTVFLGVMLFCFAAALLFGNRVPKWRGLKLLLLGVFFFFTDVGLLLSNAQLGDFPVCAVFAILMLSAITEDQEALPAPEARSYRPGYAAVLCLGALLFVPLFTADVVGLAFGAWQKAHPSPWTPVIHFTSDNLKPLIMYDEAGNPPAEGRRFTAYVNDGVALLQRESRPDEKIMTLDWTDPFPFAMERQPPHHGHFSPVYHFNIDDAHRPTDAQFFGDADIVMVPKRASLGDKYFVDMYKAYEPGLKERYNLVAESNLWWMYRRK